MLGSPLKKRMPQNVKTAKTLVFVKRLKQMSDITENTTKQTPKMNYNSNIRDHLSLTH